MEQRKDFILESIKFAGITFFQNLGLMCYTLLPIIGLFVALTILTGVILGVASRLFYHTVDVLIPHSSTFWLGRGIVGLVVYALCKAGLLRIALDLIRNKKSAIERMWLDWRVFAKSVGAYLLYALLTVLGLALFIIPGLIWIVRSKFFLLFIVDKDRSIIEAFKDSWELTRGYFWSLLAWNILYGLISFAVMIFSWHFAALCETYVYEYLLGVYGQNHEKFESMI